jgi:hypothetical protein
LYGESCHRSGDASGISLQPAVGNDFPRRRAPPSSRLQNRRTLPVLHYVAVASDAATPSAACLITDKDAMGATL